MNLRFPIISTYLSVIISLMFATLASAQKPPARAGKQQVQQTKPAASISSQRANDAPSLKGLTGRYDLYSGIPTVYLGTLVMMEGGKYKVSFSTDENDFESGTYAYHAESTSIEWMSGLFKRKEWSGKLIKKEAGYRIELNKSTFAEN
jgi:hypothetical protein